jgi:hypothetical protein
MRSRLANFPCAKMFAFNQGALEIARSNFKKSGCGPQYGELKLPSKPLSTFQAFSELETVVRRIRLFMMGGSQ